MEGVPFPNGEPSKKEMAIRRASLGNASPQRLPRKAPVKVAPKTKAPKKVIGKNYFIRKPITK